MAGPPTLRHISDILTEFNFITSAQFSVVLFFVGEGEIGLVKEGMVAKGFTPQPLYWYKTDLNVSGDPGRWTQAVENAVIGVKGHEHRGSHMSLNPNPTYRHNIIHGPALHTFSKHFGRAGVSVINQHEKPEYVVQAMLGPYLKPGDNVIVAGSGAGGEVRGLLALGVHVVGLENDPRQYMALNALMISWSPPRPSLLAFTRDAMLAAMKYSKAYVMTNSAVSGQAEDDGAPSSPLCTSCSSPLSEVEFEWCEVKKCQKAVCVQCVEYTDAGKKFCKKCIQDLVAVGGNPASSAGGAAI